MHNDSPLPLLLVMFPFGVVGVLVLWTVTSVQAGTFRRDCRKVARWLWGAFALGSCAGFLLHVALPALFGYANTAIWDICVAFLLLSSLSLLYGCIYLPLRNTVAVQKRQHEYRL